MALIDAYLDGDLDAAGIARFEAWLLADRQHQVAFARAARIDTSLRVAVAAREVRQASELDSVAFKQPTRRPRLRRSSARALNRSWPRYAAGLMAAAAMVMVACGVGWMYRPALESVPEGGAGGSAAGGPPQARNMAGTNTEHGTSRSEVWGRFMRRTLPPPRRGRSARGRRT